MGFYKLLALLIGLSVLLTPLIALKGGENTHGEALTQTTDGQLQENTIADKTQQLSTVRVLRNATNQVEQLSVEEYLKGVLAAEMPAAYHTQALKAQAVAAYTYLLYKKQSGTQEYDITDDPTTHQGYIDESQRREKWGDKADSYEKKVAEAVDEVKGKYITYNGEPIMAAFHAISCGTTLSAQTVWGGEVSYLLGVPSPGDKLSPDCIKTVVMTAAEFSSAAAMLEGCVLDGEAEQWLGKIETDSTGYVKKIEIGSQEYTGMQVRDAFGLRSAVFTAGYSDGSFRFTVTGYGHCVGMSQYGADYMARQGSDWEEIIRHYYSGVKIEGI